MVSSLGALPAEIFYLIIDKLSRRGIGTLRLTCRDLEKNSLFTNVRTDLSRESLSRLKEFGQIEHLAQNISDLHINEDSYRRLGTGFKWRLQNSEELKQSFELNQTLVRDILRDSLVEKLTKCRSFHFLGSIPDTERASHSVHDDRGRFTIKYAIDMIFSVAVERDLRLMSFTIAGRPFDTSCRSRLTHCIQLQRQLCDEVQKTAH